MYRSLERGSCHNPSRASTEAVQPQTLYICSGRLSPECMHPGVGELARAERGGACWSGGEGRKWLEKCWPMEWAELEDGQGPMD